MMKRRYLRCEDVHFSFRMVRLKNRYILFDILYTGKGLENATSQSEALLALHQPSPAAINAKIILAEVRNAIQTDFGDFGSGTTGFSLTVKYFSNATSTGIIRVSRENYRTACFALARITRLGSSNVIVRCIRVSGTIKKCEDAAMKRSQKFVQRLEYNAVER